MATPSQKQIEANRRNARKSTGPKSAEGKAKSRRNGLKHGLAAQVIVPEDHGPDLQRALARWNREAGPDDVVEHHLIKRAAVSSVTLDRLDDARESTRTDAVRRAVEDWESRHQARARRKAQDLNRDPSGVVADLQATAFGCDWLIRQWEQLDAPLRLGNPWPSKTLMRAQKLLGLPDGVPGPDAEPEIRVLWILAAAMDPDAITPLSRLHPDERALPTEPIAARATLRSWLADKIETLLDLRAEAWEVVEAPEYRALVIQSSAADISAEGQLRHRYARDADRSCNAAVRLYLNIRDRRRAELLAIAKEARQCDTPRAPVGLGWWREPDSAPAPPGFTRIIPELDAQGPLPQSDPKPSSSASLPLTDNPSPIADRSSSNAIDANASGKAENPFPYASATPAPSPGSSSSSAVQPESIPSSTPCSPSGASGRPADIAEAPVGMESNAPGSAVDVDADPAPDPSPFLAQAPDHTASGPESSPDTTRRSEPICSPNYRVERFRNFHRDNELRREASASFSAPDQRTSPFLAPPSPGGPPSDRPSRPNPPASPGPPSSRPIRRR